MTRPPRRPAFESRLRVGFAIVLPAFAVCCAAVPRAALPLPASAPVSSASAPDSGAPPVAPAIEADFVVDSAATVHASVSDVHAMLLEESNLTHVLPYTRSAERVGVAESGGRNVRLVQGTSLIHVEYTLHISDEGPVVRFHLQKHYPHGIEDSQGFFELTAEAPDRTRVRFVNAVDLGGGIARLLFKEQIRKSALTTPILVRDYMEHGRPRKAPAHDVD